MITRGGPSDPAQEVTSGGLRAIGGGLEGAQQTTREMALWIPSFRSPDQVINTVKPMADARARDLVGNDGYIQNAVFIHRDSIIGSHYLLNSTPSWTVLGYGADQNWAEEFAQFVEARFNLLAESPDCWFDARGQLSFTGLLRLVAGCAVLSGEVVQTAEWDKDTSRPFSTNIQMVATERLSNPQGRIDNRYLRRGVWRNLKGRPQGYFFREAYPTELWDSLPYSWKYVPARKPWGRKQVLHYYEPMYIDQTRGISNLVAVMMPSKMTKNLEQVTLQNAIVQATYAAAIESDLPPQQVYAQMGGGQPPLLPGIGSGTEGWTGSIAAYLAALQSYVGGAQNVQIDGVKIPHLFPGTKLHLQPAGHPGGVGDDFYKSLLRHLSAGIGTSYEELSNDFSSLSYSTARAVINNTGKRMRGQKKVFVDRNATDIYSLVMEEWVNDTLDGTDNLPLTRAMKAEGPGFFYSRFVKDAICSCRWTGSGAGQVDELKETQAAILRIKSGISTYEEEIARFSGGDWRAKFEQRAREEGVIKAKGLDFALETTRPGTPKDQLGDQNETGGKVTEEPSDKEETQ